MGRWALRVLSCKSEQMLHVRSAGARLCAEAGRSGIEAFEQWDTNERGTWLAAAVFVVTARASAQAR